MTRVLRHRLTAFYRTDSILQNWQEGAKHSWQSHLIKLFMLNRSFHFLKLSVYYLLFNYPLPIHPTHANLLQGKFWEHSCKILSVLFTPLHWTVSGTIQNINWTNLIFVLSYWVDLTFLVYIGGFQALNSLLKITSVANGENIWTMAWFHNP